MVRAGVLSTRPNGNTAGHLDIAPAPSPFRVPRFECHFSPATKDQEPFKEFRCFTCCTRLGFELPFLRTRVIRYDAGGDEIFGNDTTQVIGREVN
jgi:hypothetical protein